MKIVVAALLHETNTYCAEPTGLDEFRLWETEEQIAELRQSRMYAGGMLAAAEEIGAEGVVAFAASAEPSGTIRASAYDALKEDLLSRLKDALPADAVALSLHGAAVVEGIDDMEADLAREVRGLVGADVPIVVSLDLHGNITQAMADPVQVLLGVHEYPHIDMYERGYEAVKMLPALLRGDVKPVTHVERLPMLLPTTTTFGGPMLEVNQLCETLERQPGVIDVTFFHGFPYTDVPEVGAMVVVTTDGDVELAKRLARQVAQTVWDRRDAFLPTSLSPAEAIAAALDVGAGPVVINETSDNSGGGAPGDGTHLLRAMLDAGLEDACFGYITDAEVAAAAHRAGCGATIDISLGGKTDRLHGEPIKARAYVKALTDGRFSLQAFAKGLSFDLGPMCRLRIDGIDVIVGSKRSQTFDPELFLLHGIDVARYRIVALKSSQHFRAAFEPIAKAIVTADPPGMTTLHVETFARDRTPRPIWPLDAEATYSPG